MFSNSVPHLTHSYRIDSGLIAIGDTTWQTKNITSISIDQHRLKFTEREPEFSDSKPAPTTRWGLLALALAVAWTIAITTDHPGAVGWLLTGLLILGSWFVRHYSHKNSLRTWSQRRDRTAKQQIVWKRLASSVPMTFNLILESSSGRSVALSTFDKNSAMDVHNAILAAMRDKGTPPVNGSIRTIDSSAGPVETLYERYCQSEIASA